MQLCNHVESSMSAQADTVCMRPAVGSQRYEYKQRSKEVFTHIYNWWLPLVCVFCSSTIFANCNLTVHVSDRRILLFPRGNRQGATFLSAYLDCGEPQAQPNNWTRRAAFKLQILNQLDPSKTISKGVCYATSCRAAYSCVADA